MVIHIHIIVRASEKHINNVVYKLNRTIFHSHHIPTSQLVIVRTGRDNIRITRSTIQTIVHYVRRRNLCVYDIIRLYDGRVLYIDLSFKKTVRKKLCTIRTNVFVLGVMMNVFNAVCVYL